jgi:hypothetical protein
VAPISMSVTLTVAPEMGAPLESVTVPRMRAVPCACAGTEVKRNSKLKPRTGIALLTHRYTNELILSVTEFIRISSEQFSRNATLAPTLSDPCTTIILLDPCTTPPQRMSS